MRVFTAGNLAFCFIRGPVSHLHIDETSLLRMLAQDLGYEDVDELEDALKGELGEFISLMPHFESKRIESNSEDKSAEIQFRMGELPTGEPQCIEIKVESVRDLYRVVLKPAGARIIIPQVK